MKDSGDGERGPLSHVRVLDLTRILAGPSCTQILGDLGAQVIKVERPGAGDDTRRFAPPYIPVDDGSNLKQSAYFCAANRNKQSITLDLSKVRGQEIARQLIAKSDVLVENFKHGDLAKYGLSYEHLAEAFPRLIYCSITGFGHSGPYAKRPGYDLLIQGMSGLMSCTGEPNGMPMKSAVPAADLMAGMYAATSLNAALVHQALTGQGQHIDIGMLDVMVAFSSILGSNYLATGDVPERLGNAHPNIVPYQVFESADGAIVLAVGNDQQFKAFCAFAGLDVLATDERFETNQCRLQFRDELVGLIADRIKQESSAYWLKGLETAGVSCGPINDMQQVFDDPHVIARQMKINMAFRGARDDRVEMIGSPVRLSRTPVTYRHAPPRLGEDTAQVLQDVLGVGDTELGDLRTEGVI
jgi:crotonobetainyl-CoA:carnitine CoA-transferase CaiB-like acyl-CoA transferase